MIDELLAGTAWQPIATARKARTPILGLDETRLATDALNAVAVIYWEGARLVAYVAADEGPDLFRRLVNVRPGYWRIAGGDNGAAFTPTHWTPLHPMGGAR